MVVLYDVLHFYIELCLERPPSLMSYWYCDAGDYTLQFADDFSYTDPVIYTLSFTTSLCLCLMVGTSSHFPLIAGRW